MLSACFSTIGNGAYNTLVVNKTNCAHAVLNGLSNRLSAVVPGTTAASTIIFTGQQNTLSALNNNQALFNGLSNFVAKGGLIYTGCSNLTSPAINDDAMVMTGSWNSISASAGYIMTGMCNMNRCATSTPPVIYTGFSNCINCANQSQIINGCMNEATGVACVGVRSWLVLGGARNCIISCPVNSIGTGLVIMGGENNKIAAQQPTLDSVVLQVDAITSCVLLRMYSSDQT